jgi:hypothetical protein
VLIVTIDEKDRNRDNDGDRGEKGRGKGHTNPVNVHPGTSKCTPTFVSLRSKLKCSASAFTAALLALYAGLPGGFVIPCFDPVITIAPDERAWNDGT